MKFKLKCLQKILYPIGIRKREDGAKWREKKEKESYWWENSPKGYKRKELEKEL